MFEKEAKKWVENNLHSTEEDYIKAFKDGAKLGYNKAKEEIKLLKETHRQSLKILTDQIEELHKANEWHYVKDGDLPKGEGTYLAVWQNDNGYKEIFIMKYEEDDEEEFHWLDDDYEVQDEYVIAWKEIELPKEIKEND